MRTRTRASIIAITVAAIAFAAFLAHLYLQLEAAFERREEFVPTRIYSDVTRIAPPASFKFAKDRLTRLGYASTADGDTIRFGLHPINYPTYLLPDGHPIENGKSEQDVALKFDGNSPDSALLA